MTPDISTHPLATHYVTTTNQPVYLLRPSEIKPHEHIDSQYAWRLCRSIREFGYFTTPILVDRHGLILLDGHHRYWALSNNIGANRVPAMLVDYDDHSLISVSSWRDDVVVDQEVVRHAALSRRLLQPKTSRHILYLEIGEVMIPLTELTRRVEDSLPAREKLKCLSRT
ncbi:ParB N-terminal domain-containing protein [Bradyrhizobium sp. WSM 1738]|uniref:ParB N-terminal domain-containing protein n=1 Tax=Bradyrhizobium hereditatis TaxID=2821405 RepID=UPI001CE2C762|nr:ParB N-terminal domain-containing protein [Bradyrhizobium hereditatis]